MELGSSAILGPVEFSIGSVMAWYQTGNKPLPKLILVMNVMHFLTPKGQNKLIEKKIQGWF